MSLTVLMWGLAALALVSLLAGLLLVRNASPFFYWLKALGGVTGLALAVVMVVAVLELYQHQTVKGVQPVASLSITHLDGDRWQLTLFGPGHRELTREVRGEMWQLQGQLLAVQPWAQALGLMPAVKLSDLNGRMRELEESLRPGGRSQQPDSPSPWYEPGLNLLPHLLYPLYQTQPARPVFAPLRDGAVFDVWLSGQQLVAAPANNEAEMAWEQWR
ncbi:MAG: hypothetical protein EA349_10405 [Halomonadaceae bacterium]|nr:MAG: hypothetical protein EA349_10405 [Halomonadaceae bacterium]